MGDAPTAGGADQPMLVVEAVDKVFRRTGKPEVQALRDISLQVQAGEFVSIVGASGCGKSTLLRIIDGLDHATGGEVRVAGRTVTAPGTDRAMVFQQDSLLPWRTVADNVAYGLLLAGTRRAEAMDRIRPLLDVTGLAGFADSYPHQLSGGMRQRANVARALAVDPALLLLDEPFAALDAQTREIMQAELLRIWSATGKSVVFITHQIDEAVYLSDRVVVLSARPGRVRESIPIDLPRPRDLRVKRSPAFGQLVDRIWGLIEVEVRASMGLAAPDPAVQPHGDDHDPPARKDG